MKNFPRATNHQHLSDLNNNVLERRRKSGRIDEQTTGWLAGRRKTDKLNWEKVPKFNWAEVVAQLVDPSSQTPEIRGSNPVVGKFYLLLLLY